MRYVGWSGIWLPRDTISTTGAVSIPWNNRKYDRSIDQSISISLSLYIYIYKAWHQVIDSHDINLTQSFHANEVLNSWVTFSLETCMICITPLTFDSFTCPYLLLFIVIACVFIRLFTLTHMWLLSMCFTVPYLLVNYVRKKIYIYIS